MCISPVTIRNPYAHRDAFEYRKGRVIPMSSRLVSSQANISVPCGKCPECRKSYFSSLAQRAQMEALTSYVYMITLTYDDSHIPYLEFTTDTGIERIFYSDVRDIQLMFKRVRNLRLLGARDFRYLYAQEFGTLRFRPHHHILLFVAKLPGDSDDITPYLIERLLFSDLRKYYARNVGTRKHPVYEQLFTYAEYFHKGKKFSNYDVRLVVDPVTKLPDSTSIAKSITYILSYVNKPSVYDETLSPLFDYLSSRISEFDLVRLKRRLSAKILFSKHFGWGFYTDGSKVRPSLLSCHVSPEKRELFEFLRSLPPTESECLDMYPHFSDVAVDSSGRSMSAFDLLWRGDSATASLRDRVVAYFKDNPFDSLSDFALNYLSPVESQIFYAMLKYQPQAIRTLCALVKCSQDWSPDILPVTPYDDSYLDSAVYKTLRRYVRESISRKLGFFVFPFTSGHSIRYCGLSKYYRRYVCTADDYIALYDSCGIVDFDDYCSRFDPVHNDSYASIQSAHLKLHENRASENIIENSKNLLKSKVNSIFVPTLNTFNQISLVSRTIFTKL